MRTTVEVTLRLVAVFGAIATGVTLLRLTTGVSLPLLPFAAFLAPFVAVGRRHETFHAGAAAAVLGAVAAAVFIGEAWMAPWALAPGVPFGLAAFVLAAAGLGVGGFARVGFALADRSGAQPARSPR